MGQKSNILTLKPLKKELNLISSNSKVFLYGFRFLTFFEKLLSKKGIILLSKRLNLENNKCNFNLDLLFKTHKMLNYSRKGFLLKKKPYSVLGKKKQKKIGVLFFNQFSLFNNNLLNLTITNYNKYLDKKLIVYFYKKTVRFLTLLFPRRLNFFIDFIKISSLFVQSKINSNVYLTIIGQIFKVLPKRKHNRFLFFLKFLFNTHIDLNKSILGVKLLINGKLQGKTRASSKYIQIGSVPIQSIYKNIEFNKLHVYTRYGAFGFQFWVHKKI